MTQRQASQAPLPQAGRDLLGHAFFYAHLAIMGYIALGWLIPVPGLLIFYLVFLPLVTLQWLFNRDSCVLNNLESWIRTGSWRDPQNHEEGAFLLTIVHRLIGPRVTHAQMNAGIYTAMAVFWGLALGHLFRGSWTSWGAMWAALQGTIWGA